MPAVSFLKAPGYQDAHAGYSDPLDEQAFVTQVINFLQTKDWDSTAVIINYDDSDGWYDHQMGAIVNQSATAPTALTGEGLCGNGTNTALPGPRAAAHAQGRCGYGPRLPLVISPYAKANYVDHTMTDQTSIIRFIEDNWLNGERIGNGSFDAIAGSSTHVQLLRTPRQANYPQREYRGSEVAVADYQLFPKRLCLAIKPAVTASVF
jgi:phospholipase C